MGEEEIFETAWSNNIYLGFGHYRKQIKKDRILGNPQESYPMILNK